MKKSLMLVALCCILFLSGCDKNFSNVSVKTLNEKAAQYMEAGQYAEAASRLEASLDLNNTHPETFYNLGVAYYEMNDYEKAIKVLNEAVLLKPDFADAYYTRALVYEDWAYSILKGENATESATQNEPSEDDKKTSVLYLNHAKKDFTEYLKWKPDANDKNDINERLVQIENDLNNGAIQN